MKTSNTYIRIQEIVLEQLKYMNIHQIKVKDIASILQINRTTFYKYYDSVYHVLQEIEDDYLEGLDKVSLQLKQFPLDNKYFKEPHPAIVGVLEYIHKNREKVIILSGPHGDPSFMNKCNRLVEKHLYQKAVNEKHVMDNELIAAHIVGGLRDMLFSWIKQDNFDINTFAVIIYRMTYGQFHFLPSGK